MKQLLNLILRKSNNEALNPFDLEPKVLVNREKKIALLWSPKSACSFSIKWFFSQLNHLDAALHYNPWIHNYRTEVYYNSKKYAEDLIHFRKNLEDYLVLKVVRNPFDRAVSSFFGIPKRFYFNDYFPKELKAIEKSIKRNLPSKNGETLSFREFVDYLSTTDITKVDMHWKRQVHPLEKLKILEPKIIKLENVIQNLKKIEIEYNLDETNFEKISGSNHHLKKDSDNEEFWGDKRIEYNHNTKYPDFRNYYDKYIQQKVYEIYKSDFDTYGYSKEIDFKKNKASN